jgi:hypothetical protein
MLFILELTTSLVIGMVLVPIWRRLPVPAWLGWPALVVGFAVIMASPLDWTGTVALLAGTSMGMLVAAGHSASDATESVPAEAGDASP